MISRLDHATTNILHRSKGFEEFPRVILEEKTLMKRSDPSQDQVDVGQNYDSHAVELVTWHVGRNQDHQLSLHESTSESIPQVSNTIHIVDKQPTKDGDECNQSLC